MSLIDSWVFIEGGSCLRKTQLKLGSYSQRQAWLGQIALLTPSFLLIFPKMISRGMIVPQVGQWTLVLNSHLMATGIKSEASSVFLSIFSNEFCDVNKGFCSWKFSLLEFLWYTLNKLRLIGLSLQSSLKIF